MIEKEAGDQMAPSVPNAELDPQPYIHKYQSQQNIPIDRLPQDSVSHPSQDVQINQA